MGFAKSIWRILVAVKDGLALLFLILFFALLYILLSAGPKPLPVHEGALVIALDGVVSEQPSAVDPFSVLASREAPVTEYRQRDIVRALDLAVEDARIKAVVLDLDRFLGGGQVSLSAIGERLDRVKKAGKPVYAFATAYANDGYQLAAHATEIWMDPMGGAIVAPPGGSGLYYKELLDRIGVNVHVYRVGTYKSAVEPFIRNDQSPESKEAMRALYTEIWEDWVAEVTKARPKVKLAGIISDPATLLEEKGGNMGALALSSGMVDRLGDRMGFQKYLAEKLGNGGDDDIGAFAATSMEALLASKGPDHEGKKIGLVTIAGEIVDGEAGPGYAAGDTISQLIYDALDKGDLAALVVRVDSPGGSAFASEKIRLALEEARARKLPVVVSMANLAASGGYWVATAADSIYAEPDTITGSIGVFGVIPSGEKLLAKIGVHADGVKTGPLSGEPDLYGGFSADFDRVAQSAIENSYHEFLTRVAKARKKDVAQVDRIGQGRVWGGGTARQLGLVDHFGGVDAAIAAAAKAAGAEEGGYHVSYIEPKPDFVSDLLAGLVPQGAKAATPVDMFAHAAYRQQIFWGRIGHDVKLLTGTSGVQARCLECGLVADIPVQSRDGKGGWIAAISAILKGG